MNDEFLYYKQEEAEQYAYYSIPKELFTNLLYQNISTDAKLLYGLLRDRNQLSIKNNWTDDEGNIYIIFPREEVEEVLKIGKDKCLKIFKELNNVSLIKEVRQGLNKPNIIYVGKITQNKSIQRNSEKQSSRNRKNRVQEIEKTESNNTNINNTDLSNSTTQKSKHVVVDFITPEIIGELQSEIAETIKATFTRNSTKNLLDKTSIEVVKNYISNWDKFKKANDIRNPAKFFKDAVLKGYDIPKELKPKKQNKSNSSIKDYQQREYSDEYYNNLYVNFDSKGG